MQVSAEKTNNTVNERCRVSLKASKPSICPMFTLATCFAGVLVGSHNPIPAPRTEVNDAIRKGEERCSIFRALTNKQAPIHPSDPNNRMRENSFPGSFRFENEMELHNAVVGM